MSDQLDVMELLRRANPVPKAAVPDPAEPELMVMEEIISSSVVLPRVTTDRPSRSDGDQIGTPSRSRSRTPVIALAAFLAVVALGLVAAAVARTGSVGGDAATETRPLTDPFTVGVRWEAAMNRGDLDALMALYADAAEWVGNDGTALPRFLAGQVAFNARYELSACESRGDTLACQWTSTDDLTGATGTESMIGSMTFTLHDGLIQRFDTSISTESEAAWERASAFFEWVSESYPEVASKINDRSPEGDQVRSRLVAEWLVMGVAQEWEQAINDVDLEALMALYGETARWGQMNKAGIRDFFGWRIGLGARYELTNCLVDNSTVSCRWMTTDGFFQTAGVESLSGTMSLVVRDGLVIEHFEGVSYSESTLDWNQVLQEFDAWVQTAHPELTVPGQHGFITFTPESAELHLELVEEWVATR